MALPSAFQLCTIMVMADLELHCIGVVLLMLSSWSGGIYQTFITQLPQQSYNNSLAG